MIAKIKKLWNKQNQSCLIAEKIHEKLGVYLKSPNQTRCNSYMMVFYKLKIY